MKNARDTLHFPLPTAPAHSHPHYKRQSPGPAQEERIRIPKTATTSITTRHPIPIPLQLPTKRHLHPPCPLQFLLVREKKPLGFLREALAGGLLPFAFGGELGDEFCFGCAVEGFPFGGCEVLGFGWVGPVGD